MLFSRSSKSDPNRGYLGVEHDPEAGNDGIRILRVLPGTPAEIAGLKPGDHLLEIDKVRIAAGESIAGRIGSLAPGTKVELSVRRGEDIIAMSAVLTLPFAALREMLEDASFDNERMAILRAAASDRRFTAAELKGVCETFSFDESREEAAKLALPRLVDPQNAYQILATFSFSSGKENVGRKIEEVLKSRK